ncbi:hypothetical protein DVA67_015935 [Solirubrobacter sp. CPCC 204708]|nr:hypothetical protein [Solirubrobacter deserti]
MTGARRPVVFMFHGSSGTGEQFFHSSGWREMADQTGLVAVFPTGLRYRVLETGRLTTKWNDFSLAAEIDTNELPPGSDAGAPVPADDVSFVDAMVADLQGGLPIDGRRVYAAGFSNGAGFAARLSVDRAEQLAAAAYSGGGGMPAGAAPARPVPTLLSLGTDDPKVIDNVDPTLPALPLDPALILTTPALSDFFGLYHAAFGLDPALYGAIADPGVSTLRWPASGLGANGALLKLVMLEGLRHRYPDTAAAESWHFFAEHRASA